MTKLEDTVRRLLEEAAPEPPADSAPSSAAPSRRRRSYAPLLAAAAVVVLVAAVLVGRAVWPNRHTGESSTPPVAAAGTQLVTYFGVSIQVPVTWRVAPALCGPYPHTNSVIPTTGEVASCPMQPVTQRRPDPRYTTITLVPSKFSDPGITTSAVNVDGVRATLGITSAASPASGVLTVPSRGMAVEVTAPTVADVRAVLATARVTPIDTHGCVDRADPITVGQNSPSRSLVPGSPTAGVVCQYLSGSRGTYRLVGSRNLTGRQIERLEKLLSSGSTGVSSLARQSNWLVRYQFRYADGTTRTVDATLDLDPGIATDGQRSTSVPYDLPRAFP